MTGFASLNIVLTTPEGGRANLVMNIKSFNSRYFEATCRLPYSLTGLEAEFIKKLQTSLIRGHIYLTINMDNQTIFKGDIQPAINIVDGYIRAIDTIKEKLDITTNTSLDNILRLPDIFTIEDRGIDEQSKKTIFESIDHLIQQIISAREQEGTTLEIDLIKRIAIMQQEIEIIEQKAVQLIEEQKEKINLAVIESGFDENTMADIRRNALMEKLDKMDINEEIVRFKSHVKSVQEQFKSEKVEKGKRLDFTLQEMAREINTVTAKCSSADISFHAINIKVEIEKVREQIQNIV